MEIFYQQVSREGLPQLGFPVGFKTTKSSPKEANSTG